MLKVNQVIATVTRKGEVVPRFLDCADGPNTCLCRTLIQTFTDCVGGPRRQLTDRLKLYLQRGSRDNKLVKGLVEILMGFCEFETFSAVPPSEIRQVVFGLAASRFATDGPPQPATRTKLIQESARILGVTQQEVEKYLFGDLKEEQLLAEFKAIEPQELLNRYNVGLVQGTLLKAVSCLITFYDVSPTRLRQIVRYLKFFRLIFQIERLTQNVIFRVDGPLSIFEKTRSYGIRFANFFPFLLLANPFELRAELWWGRKNRLRTLRIDSSAPLRPYVRDTGTWTPQELQATLSRMKSLGKDRWEISTECNPFVLPNQQVIVPDFLLKTKGGEKKVYVEIFWPWRRVNWDDLFDAFINAGPPNYVLCLPKKGGNRPSQIPPDPRFVQFVHTPPAQKIMEFAETIRLTR